MRIIVRRPIIWISLGLGCVLMLSIAISNALLTNFMGLLSIGLLGHVAYKYRNHASLYIALLFVVYSTYSIWVAIYLCPELRPAFFNQFYDQSVYKEGMQCIYIFASFLWIFVHSGKYTKGNVFQKNNQIESVDTANAIVSIGCAVIAIIIILTNFTYGGIEKRSEGTTIYEYKIILYIIGMLYSGHSKFLKSIWICMTVFACALTFAGGNRADAIPLIIAVIFYYFNKLDYKVTTALVAVGVVLMVAVGSVRQEIVYGGIDLGHIINRIWKEKLTFDTAYWAYIPAIASIEVVKQTSYMERLRVLVGQFIYIVGGGRYSGYKLEFYVKQFYNHVNGFVSPVYFYFWFGIGGAVLFAGMVYGYLRAICKNQKIHYEDKKKKINNMISAYFIAMVPRWYLYDPLSLMRGVMIMWICGTFTVYTEAFLFNRKQRKKIQMETR